MVATNERRGRFQGGNSFQYPASHHRVLPYSPLLFWRQSTVLEEHGIWRSDFAEVMQYCRRSADPVGRLLLHLFGAANEENLKHSDAICSGLQLINFCQDVGIDWGKNRVYLPQDELQRYGVSESQIAQGDTSGQWKALMRFQVERARALIKSGAPLGRALPGRIGLEIRTIVEGGLCILEKIDKVKGDVYHHRPVLQAWDWPLILARVLAR